MYYICLNRQIEYIEPGIDSYENKKIIKTLKRLQSQAAKLGYQLEELKIA